MKLQIGRVRAEAVTGMADAGLDVCHDCAGTVPVGKGRGESVEGPTESRRGWHRPPSRLCRSVVAGGLGRIARKGPSQRVGYARQCSSSCRIEMEFPS